MKILQSFQDRRKDIISDFSSLENSQVDYKPILNQLEQLSAQEFHDIVGPTPEAEPIIFEEPLYRTLGPFLNPLEMKTWAIDKLSHSSLLAVDGSQIFPTKELSYPKKIY